MRVKAFKAWRPAEGKAESVASVPYDVVDTKGAAALAAGNPESFLHVVRAEIDLPEGTDAYSDAVYDQAKTNIERFKNDGVLIREENPFDLSLLTADGRSPSVWHRGHLPLRRL